MPPYLRDITLALGVAITPFDWNLDVEFDSDLGYIVLRVGPLAIGAEYSRD